MLFSIVIPAFNCKETIHLPLASLMTQIFKDFEIIIVDDCSTESFEAEVEPFKKFMDIKIIRNKVNGGCGPTLQHGLDVANGDYFIPIDADDMFATAETLLHFARLIQKNNYPDAVLTSFMEYDPETGRMTLIDQNNSAFIHGKCYKVEFCRDNDITFPNQKWFEDGAFNFIALNISKDIVKDGTVTYLWQSNKQSITRSQDYNVLVQPYYIKAYTRAFPILAKKDKRQANFFISGLIGFGYYYWTAFNKRKVEQKLIDELIENLKEAFESSNVIESINNDKGLFDELSKGDSRAKSMVEAQEGPFFMSITLNEWLNKFFNQSIKWLEVENV